MTITAEIERGVLAMAHGSSVRAAADYFDMTRTQVLRIVAADRRRWFRDMAQRLVG